MNNILITGGKGQLAQCIKDIAKNLNGFHFIYVDLDELDITDPAAVDAFFEANHIKYCINCAAYTDVDKAENDPENTFLVNVEGTLNLAKVCLRNDAGLIQISTDFVFDGSQSTPYEEQDFANPINVYGTTKLKGEKAVESTLKEHFIIRTSWLYSEYGHNFVKTMLRLGRERDTLGVVADQIGTPTYAGDLAKILIGIITNGSTNYGTYHYSNEGVASWYDFSKAIFDFAEMDCKVLPIKTKDYPTPAKRPAFSVMDKTKIKKIFTIEIPYWRESLKKCLLTIKV